MTFPSVASSVCAACNGGAATTTHDITLPSGTTAGDLILIVWTFPNSATTTFTPPTGWQCLREQRSSASSPTVTILYRFADGSEGSTLSITTNLSVISTYVADRITGAGGVAYNKFDTSSGTLNPPACTSPWGTQDILWMAYAALQDGYVIGSGPASYSGFATTVGTSGVNGSAIGRAYRQLNALSTDPGTFGSVTSTSNVMLTVAVLAADATDPAPQYLGRSVFTQASTSQTDSVAFTSIIIPAGATTTQGRPHIEAGDAIIVMIEAANELLASNYYDADGFTQVATYGQGTAAAAGAVSLQVFAKLSADGSETSFTYGDPGNHFSGTCLILRPPKGYEIQIEDEAGSTQTAIGSSVTSVDTFSVAGRAAVLLLMALDRDSLSTSNISSFETGNTGGMTEAIDQTSTTGVGGGVAAAFGVMDAGGAIGAIGFTPSASPPTANVATMTLALKCVATGGSPTDDLVADGIATGAPALDTPALSQAHAVSPSALASGSPSLGSPSLSQVHSLAPAGLDTGAATLGTPALSSDVSDDLEADGLDAGTPSIDAPALSQAHVLNINELVSGAVVLGTPSLSQVHGLTATGVETAAPSLASPAVVQAQLLAPESLDLGAPSLGAPGLSQVHALSPSPLNWTASLLDSPSLSQSHVLAPEGLATGAVLLGSPDLGFSTHNLDPTSLTTGAVSVGVPSFTQAQLLGATGLVAGSPALPSPPLSQSHVLTAVALSTAAPVLDTPDLVERQAITPLGIVAGSPSLDSPVLNETQLLVAVALTTGAALFAPVSLSQVHALLADGVTTGVPVLDDVNLRLPSVVPAERLVRADNVSRIVRASPLMRNAVADVEVRIARADSAPRIAMADPA